MMQPNLRKEGRDASPKRMQILRNALAAVAVLPSIAACVQVTAPERPIEINLNINIRQEVVVRLQEDVRELIQQNPGVF
jgi:hypothetical protein